MNGYKVNNISEYGKTCEYIVARFVDDELWFYGGYHTEEKAAEVAAEVNGIAIENK